MVILVSACLLGLFTRYDGMQSKNQQVLDILKEHTLVPVCPEQLGGLPTPRPPCEIINGRVIDKNGEDRTAAFVSGAQAACEIYKICDCEAAILKARSPSCGKGQVYDGSFTGQLIKGDGVTARQLMKLAYPVYTEEELPQLAQWISQQTPCKALETPDEKLN